MSTTTFILTNVERGHFYYFPKYAGGALCVCVSDSTVNQRPACIVPLVRGDGGTTGGVSWYLDHKMASEGYEVDIQFDFEEVP